MGGLLSFNLNSQSRLQMYDYLFNTQIFTYITTDVFPILYRMRSKQRGLELVGNYNTVSG